MLLFLNQNTEKRKNTNIIFQVKKFILEKTYTLNHLIKEYRFIHFFNTY